MEVKRQSRRLLKTKPPCKCRRGRSSHLLKLRDIYLVKRFYEYSEVQRLRIDDVLNTLSTQEFFIEEQTIWNIVRKNSKLLDALNRGESIDIQIKREPTPEDN